MDVSRIGLGCMQFAGRGLVAAQFYAGLDQPTVTSIVRSALDGGVTWFDTAEMYGGGTSERMLSTALHDLDVKPGAVTVATKWSPIGRSAAHLRRSAETRLTNLQGYPIDLFQIHMPWGSLSPLRSQLNQMIHLYRHGQIAAAGVSNFSAARMTKAHAYLTSHGVPLASNQVQISLLHRNVERDGVLAAARRLGVQLIAYSPLRSGLLTGTFHDDPARTKSIPPMRRRVGGFTNLAKTAPLIAELKSIAKAHGATPAQIALAWVITYYGDTVVAIPGASKPHQAKESAEAMNLHLTDRELTHLADLTAR